MEECFDTCPEGANLVYNLWKLGDLNLLLRCRIHAFEISGVLTIYKLFFFWIDFFFFPKCKFLYGIHLVFSIKKFFIFFSFFFFSFLHFSQSHDISQVVHRAKMDYVPELGWETEFLSETLRSWIHAWIRSSKQSFGVFV